MRLGLLGSLQKDFDKLSMLHTVCNILYFTKEFFVKESKSYLWWLTIQCLYGYMNCLVFHRKNKNFGSIIFKLLLRWIRIFWRKDMCKWQQRYFEKLIWTIFKLSQCPCHKQSTKRPSPDMEFKRRMGTYMQFRKCPNTRSTHSGS